MTARPFAALAVLALTATPRSVAAGDHDRGPQTPPPSLVVVITVDQFRGDYLDRFGREFTGGLARLMREGAVFGDAYQDHGMTETAPGHATVLSGRNPGSTGIIRNSRGVNDSTPLLEVTTGLGASPQRFRGTALFDWMQARWPQAHALSVSKKDRGAILPLGRARQAVYWYEAGQFTTSRYYADALPAWVRAFNRGAVVARAPGVVWDLLRAPDRYPEPDSAPYENRGRDVMFPHTLAADSARAATQFLYTPWMDSLTLSFALRGTRELRLGLGRHPDLLAVSLSATDYIGHTYGPNSREAHDQVLRLDRALGWFLDSLARIERGRRIVLVLTADHGVTPFPEWSREHGHPDAGYVALDTLVRRWNAALTARLGAGAWLPFFDSGLLTADRPALAARGVNVDSLIALIRADILRVPGVARVDTRAGILAADTATDAVARRWSNVIQTDGDGIEELFVALKDWWVFGVPGGSAEHGQVSDLDAHVALVFWGAGIRRGTHTNRVSVVDIAPTLADILGVTPGEVVQGRILREALPR